jgi:hypothetical protein
MLNPACDCLFPTEFVRAYHAYKGHEAYIQQLQMTHFCICVELYGPLVAPVTNIPDKLAAIYQASWRQMRAARWS